MAGSGGTKRLRLFVRSSAAARTPDFIGAPSFEIYLGAARTYTALSSILNELRRRSRIFLGCAGRKTPDRQLHTYDVRGWTPSRFILCSTFSALQGVTRIPRRRGNRCYPRRVHLIADRQTDGRTETFPSRSPAQSFFHHS